MSHRFRLMTGMMAEDKACNLPPISSPPPPPRIKPDADADRSETISTP